MANSSTGLMLSPNWANFAPKFANSASAPGDSTVVILTVSEVATAISSVLLPVSISGGSSSIIEILGGEVLGVGVLSASKSS